MPASSIDGPGLLKALAVWVRAEAAAVRAKGTGGPRVAVAYAAALNRWADAVGGETPVPRVTPALRKAACAVDALADERLALAVALYRRDYRLVTRDAPEPTGLRPDERTANHKRKRQTPAEQAAQLAEKEETKKRKATKRAFAVRVHPSAPPQARPRRPTRPFCCPSSDPQPPPLPSLPSAAVSRVGSCQLLSSVEALKTPVRFV